MLIGTVAEAVPTIAAMKSDSISPKTNTKLIAFFFTVFHLLGAAY
jgi:hypothetical protein